MTPTVVSRLHRIGSRLFRGVLAAFVILAAGLTWGSSVAVAIPPDGPSPNTPGTWSTVSPTSLEPGGLLRFSVGGFPPGETLYIKIDDGTACSQSATHGACVYHTQAIPSSGVVNGSFYIPGDIGAGTHWLRFLASAPAPGGGGGTIGFTLRSPDFTITSGTGSGGSTGGSSGSTGGSSGGGSGAGSGGTASGGSASGGSSGSGSTAGGSTGGGGAATESGEAAAAPGETVRVEAGEVSPEPDFTPVIPAETGEGLESLPAGDVVAEVIDDRVVLTVSEDHAGEWVFTYGFSEPTELGWQQVAVDGTVTVPTSGVGTGSHRFAVIDVDEELLGWTTVEISEAAADVSPAAAESASDESGLPLAAIGALAVAVLALAGILFVILRRSPAPKAADSPDPS